jgi:hypothetical protein
MAYFTNDELNTFLGKSISADDYTRVHDFVKQRIENYCGQEFEQSTYTENRMLDDTIYLKHQPVATIAQVTDQTGTIIDPTTYDVYPWGIAFYQNPYTRMITIQYTAGYSTVPQPIKELALWMTKKILVKQDMPEGQALNSMTTNGITMVFQHADLYNNRLTGDDYWDAVANQFRKWPKVI